MTKTFEQYVDFLRSLPQEIKNQIMSGDFTGTHIDAGEDVTPASMAVEAAYILAFNHSHGWADTAHKVLSWVAQTPMVGVPWLENAEGAFITESIQPRNLSELEIFGDFCAELHDEFSHPSLPTFVCSHRAKKHYSKLSYDERLDHGTDISIIEHRTATGRVSWTISERRIIIQVHRKGIVTGPVVGLSILLKTQQTFLSFESRGGSFLPRHVATLRYLVESLPENIFFQDKGEELRLELAQLESASIENLKEFDLQLQKFSPEEPLLFDAKDIAVSEQKISERFSALEDRIQSLNVGFTM